MITHDATKAMHLNSVNQKKYIKKIVILTTTIIVLTNALSIVLTGSLTYFYTTTQAVQGTVAVQGAAAVQGGTAYVPEVAPVLGAVAVLEVAPVPGVEAVPGVRGNSNSGYSEGSSCHCERNYTGEEHNSNTNTPRKHLGIVKYNHYCIMLY